MSSIEKLSIQGVRSFSPNSVEEIKFQTPLTLIVGTNGSGKTTIIECLKYATTGDMPPMSKSNGFLTDPQFYNITTVNAMVKLHFKNINNKLVITRNSSLSVDPTSASKKSTFKTLTKTLEDFNLKTNEKITHEPSKTIAIEDILNKYIGVSKPILDYVIFAHQEDSLWPLSDPNTLKKRFDEIFEVSRFTKELQNLNSIKKNIKVDIKLREGDLNNCKDNLKKYHVVQDRIVKLNKTLNLYDAERVQLEEKLKEIADAQQNLMNINQSYVDIINEFTQLTSSKDNMLKQLHEMSKKYPRIDERESRDQLNHELQKVINSIKGLTVETSSDYPRQLEKFNSLLEKCNAAIVTKSTQLGGLKQAEKSYHLNKKEVNELTAKHSYLNPLSKDEVRKIIDKKQFERGEFMKEVKKKSDEFKSVINECRTNIGKMEFENKHLSMQSSTLESEMTVLQNKISNLESNILYRNGNAETVEYENRKLIEEIEKELANELSDASISQKEKELKLKTSHLQELDEALASIRKNIIKAKQGSESSTMFHLRKSDLTRSLEASTNLKVCEELENLVSEFNTYNKDINFDSSDGIKTYIEELNGLQTRLSDLLSKNTITYKNLTSEIKNLETTKSQLTTKLNKETLDLKRSEKLIKELEVQKSNYEETLSDKLDLTSDKPTLFQNFEDNLLILKENLDDINDSIGTNTGMIQVFQHAKKTILKKKCCNICKTSFENDEEKMNLALEYVNKKINTDVNESIKEKEQAEKEYNEYLKLRSTLEKYCDCREKLQKENDDFKILLSSKETSGVELSKLTRSIKEVESTIKQVENSIKCVESWYDFVKNISEQSMKLHEMRKDLDEHHTDEHIDINALAGKQDTMVAKRTELSSLISTLSSEISSLKASKVSKEHSKSKYEDEIIRSKEIQEEASSLKEQLSAKEETLSKNKEVLNENTEQIIKLKDELIVNQKQLESHEGENGGKIKLLEQELDQMKTVTRRVFDQLLPEIKKYEDFEQENITKCTKELEGLEAEASSLKQKITDTNQLIQKARVELETCNKKKEEINQVLNYLTLKEKYIIICDKLANINEQEVMEYQNEYSSTAQELNMAFTDISSEISSKKGEIRQIKNQIETDVKTRDNDYADIEQKYHEINCNSKTLLNMEHDLDIASKIIEMSIMNFHSKKMEEINVLLDELWRTTYKGSDIATIKIVTEKVKKNSTASGSNIESYNYKVVMYKDALEIDMRGRCSAGQKVMACILIRLALAETFGVSCGVITLDEPTTNLDQENAEGLAESLHRIIESRRFQQNFQIVIITHDENFLKFMNAQDFTDGFWKVSKDNNLASKIEWKSIENLIQ